ncbi:uncharacterized protein [Musca autumnalis]|uniref:uncharacterized protein n=1 Tax=Musca autumnalis TaxID=221902 RepID=UPI003CEC0B2C
MKVIALLAFIISTPTTTLACDPESNNQPQCNLRNVNIPIRNFWDPTVYWLCNSTNGIAESLKCPVSLLFEPIKRECVPFDKWVWIKPCSAATTCDPESNNEPNCDNTNINNPIRNFWDPTAYWVCRESNAAAELVKCPINKMFDSQTGRCIDSTEWVWTEPCPNQF